MKISGIYKIVNQLNGKYYIGSSSNIQGSRGRWMAHKYYLKYNKHCNDHLQRAWNLYGEQAFEFSIVLELIGASDHQLKTEEQKYLDVAKVDPTQTYNINFDAFGKCKRSEESRKKQSLSLRGRKVSDETKRRLSLAHTGKKHSREHIQNFIKAKTGTHWGRHSEETKKKMSDAQSGKKNARYDSTIYKWENLNSGEKFEGTQYDFSNTFNLDKGGVNLVLKGRRNSLFGWKILCS